MTPFEMTLLIDVHVAPFEGWNTKPTELRQQTLDGWIEDEIVKKMPETGEYRLTVRGKAWLDKALAVEMPVNVQYGGHTVDYGLAA